MKTMTMLSTNSQPGNSAYVRKKLNKTLSDFSKLFQSNPFQLLKEIPRQEAWRLFIHGKDQYSAEDRALYKNDHTMQGYFLPMGKALAFMLDTAKKRDKKIDLWSFCQSIHKLSMSEAQTGGKTVVPSNQPKSVESLIAAYQEKTCTNEADKLHSIVSLVHDLLNLKPLKDGNNRTFVTFLLNYLLITNNFPPTILEDPRNFETQKPEQLIEQVIEGMQFSIVLSHYKEIFGHKTTYDQLKTHYDFPELSDFISVYALLNDHFPNGIYDKNKDLVLAIEKHLLEQKPWHLSFFGGKTISIGDGKSITAPAKIVSQLEIIKNAKDLEKQHKFVDWTVVLKDVIYQGKLAALSSKSEDSARKQYYSLFDMNDANKFCAQFGICTDTIKSEWADAKPKVAIIMSPKAGI